MDEVNLFRGQAKNENTQLQFDDHPLKEPYDSANADTSNARFEKN
jgi:hypothetical protein